MTTRSTAWNTSKTDSLVHIAYTEAMTSDSLHYSEIDERIWRGPARPIAVIRCTEFSDYSGSSVERSNHRVLADGKFQIRLISIIGSHGYQALAYDATLGPVPADEDLQEILEGTADYALIDEDDCGSLESDMEDEAWNDHGRDDFKSALVGVLDMLDDDGGEEAGHEHELPDDDSTCTVALHMVAIGTTWGEFWYRLWEVGCDELNVNGGSGFELETGSLVYFHIDDWCAKAGKDPRYPTDEPIHLILREVAKACRMTEGK